MITTLSRWALPLSFAGLLLGSAVVGRQDPTGQEETGFEPVPVAGSVHFIRGTMGGNIGLSIGEDGVFVVDDLIVNMGSRIEEAIRKVTDGPLRFLLNTHWHGDHTGSNAYFGPKVPILAHANVRRRLAGDPEVEGRKASRPIAPGLPVLTFEDARAAAEYVSGPESGIIAQARAQLNWHNRHGFCSVCGHASYMARGGQVRRCPECNTEHYPRTDPVVITVVHDGDRCLLGQSRGRLVQMRRYSALAGFMDQGESIEEAVAREIMEEAGIQVGTVTYHSSQPWPFPSSLMIGCHADAATTDIAMDNEEMADVRWFDREEVLLALDERSSVLAIPGPLAIAYHLIRAWAVGEAG